MESARGKGGGEGKNKCYYARHKERRKREASTCEQPKKGKTRGKTREGGKKEGVKYNTKSIIFSAMSKEPPIKKGWGWKGGEERRDFFSYYGEGEGGREKNPPPYFPEVGKVLGGERKEVWKRKKKHYSNS